MIGCGACFQVQSWVIAIEQEGSPGTCEFGHGFTSKSWDTTAWSDYFERLVEIYADAEPGESGAASLALRLQEDWRIFSLDSDEVRDFLSSALPTENFDRVVRVDFDESTDHATSWSTFVDEVSHQNRFFPQSTFDRDALLAAALSSQTPLRAGTPIYRARRSEPGKPHRIDAMGPPPAEIATAGRANPVGIAYLYAAMEDHTAVHEARVANQEWCTVAVFEVNVDLQVLNLAKVDPPDAFAGDDLKTRLSSSKLVQELARELSVPMRDSDREISYVPTQYFCELVKWAGLDGVMYASAQVPNGTNIVIFDESKVSGREQVREARVTAVSSTWSYETA